MHLIPKAAQFAAQCHKNQCRKYNGAPYITHPIRVAGRTATHELATDELVAAAFLHDVVEDCNISLGQIALMFGEKVASYVCELTNIPKEFRPDANRAERKRQDRERISTISREAKVVKLIDRIDNLREIDPNEGFAQKYADESMLLVEVLEDADPVLATELKRVCMAIYLERG
jgi:(p)ppGpp synthase/HD superfamily hydrolase